MNGMTARVSRRSEGEEIPCLARIMTVVDSYDAMTSIGPTKSKMSFEEAIEAESLQRNPV